MTETRTRSENFVLILTLGILNALTPFTIDMYLPSFPQIAADLGVPVAKMGLSVSFYFIGFAFGQLLYGPLLDRFGRKTPLYFGLLMYVVSNLGCMNATSLEALLFFRFLSAVGGCAAGVGATAMVRDFFPPEAATKVFSLLMLVLSASPLLAPTIGSFLIEVATWRTIFTILAFMGVGNILLVALVLPRGYEADRSIVLKFRPILKNFKSVILNRQFRAYIGAGSFSFAGLFVYIAASPAIFMEGFKVSPQAYGGIFAILAVAMIGGGQLNLLLLKRFGSAQIFRQALLWQALAALGFFVANALDLCDLYVTIGFLFAILLGAGITYPNAASLALSPFSKNIGSASSMMGFIQLGVGSITSAGVGLFTFGPITATSAVMCVSSIIAVGVISGHKLRSNGV